MEGSTSSRTHTYIFVCQISQLRQIRNKMPGGGRAAIAMRVALRKKNGTKAHKQNGPKTNVRVLGLVQQNLARSKFTETQ